MLTGILIFLALVAVAAGYAVVCRVWPFENCPRCKGSGKRRSPSGRAFGLCRRCKGAGSRIRLGRRFWIWLSGKTNV